MKKAISIVLLIMMMLMCFGCSSGNESNKGNSEDTIKIGGLYDRTGDASVQSLQKYYATKFAIDEINASGGLLEKQLELIAPDCQSNTSRHQEMARKLIMDDGVNLIIGTSLSAQREAVRPITEQNKIIFMYNNLFEGGLASKYTFATGGHPEQQIRPLMTYMKENFGSNYYFIGADYNFGWGSAQWCEFVADELGMKCVGTEFVPLSVGEFSSSIAKIRDAKPDFIMICLTGVTQNSFWGQWQSSGMDIPICSTFLAAQTADHKRFEPPALEGLYVITNYMEEMETENAKSFNKRIREAYPDLQYVGMDCEAEYTGLMLWAEGVRRAGTLDSDAVIAEMEKGIKLENMPSGTVVLDGASHTATKDYWLAHITKDHSVVFDEKFPQSPAYWLHEVMGVDLRVDAPNVQYNVDGTVIQ